MKLEEVFRVEVNRRVPSRLRRAWKSVGVGMAAELDGVRLGATAGAS